MGEFLKQYADQPEATRRSIAQAVVKVDLQKRWELWRRHNARVAAGSSLPPAPILKDYAKLCPDLGPLDSLPPELVEFELKTRTQAGDHVSVADYATLFPQATRIIEQTRHIGETADIESDRTVIEDATHPPTIRRPGELPQRFNNYVIEGEIGRGAMGVVYRARHTVLETSVAIKSILTEQFPTQAQLDLFLNEARIAGNLRHENIVRVLEAGEFEGTYFIAMEFVEGCGLDERIRESPLQPSEAARLTKIVAQAMHYAHTRPEPVFHRDLKPANILITENGTPYICDFGIAKRVESRREARDSVVGTPSYMPPEQARGLKVDARSDVYSLGATLYALLVGRPPFAAGGVTQTLKQVVELDAVTPSELNPAIGRDVEAICLKCLSKNPDSRYPTAAALAQDLDNLLNDRPIEARPPSVVARFAKWKRREPAMARMALSIAALLAFSAVGGAAAAFITNAARNQAVLAQEEEARQRELAESNYKEAEEQRGIAQKNFDDAERQRQIAQENFDDAEKQRGIAQENFEEAEKQRKEAEKQRGIAQANFENAEANRKLAVEAREKEKQQRVFAEAKRLEAEQARQEAERAEQTAQRERSVAKLSYDVSSEIISDLFRGVREKLDSFPNSEQLQKDILGSAENGLQRLSKINSDTASSDVTLRSASAQLQRARFSQLSGNVEEAGQLFNSALESARQARVTSEIEALKALRGRAEVADSTEEEGQRLLDAVERARELVREFPDQGHLQIEAAATLNSYAAYLALQADQTEDSVARRNSIDLYREALAVFQTAIELLPAQDRRGALIRQARSTTNLAQQLASQKAGRPSQSELTEACENYIAALEIQVMLLRESNDSVRRSSFSQLTPDSIISKVTDLLRTYESTGTARASREVRSDVALTLVNFANAFFPLAAEAAPNMKRAWYETGHSVGGHAVRVYEDLTNDFTFIGQYHLYLTGSRYTHCAMAANAKANGSTGSAVNKTAESIRNTALIEEQLCLQNVQTFEAHQKRFLAQAEAWRELHSSLQENSKP